MTVFALLYVFELGVANTQRCFFNNARPEADLCRIVSDQSRFAERRCRKSSPSKIGLPSRSSPRLRRLKSRGTIMLPKTRVAKHVYVAIVLEPKLTRQMLEHFELRASFSKTAQIAIKHKRSKHLFRQPYNSRLDGSPTHLKFCCCVKFVRRLARESST